MQWKVPLTGAQQLARKENISQATGLIQRFIMGCLAQALPAFLQSLAARLQEEADLQEHRENNTKHLQGKSLKINLY